eukprot:1974382-Amphidinium_carterae.1
MLVARSFLRPHRIAPTVTVHPPKVTPNHAANRTTSADWQDCEGRIRNLINIYEESAQIPWDAQLAVHAVWTVFSRALRVHIIQSCTLDPPVWDKLPSSMGKVILDRPFKPYAPDMPASDDDQDIQMA